MLAPLPIARNVEFIKALSPATLSIFLETCSAWRYNPLFKRRMRWSVKSLVRCPNWKGSETRAFWTGPPPVAKLSLLPC